MCSVVSKPFFVSFTLSGERFARVMLRMEEPSVPGPGSILKIPMMSAKFLVVEAVGDAVEKEFVVGVEITVREIEE